MRFSIGHQHFCVSLFLLVKAGKRGKATNLKKPGSVPSKAGVFERIKNRLHFSFGRYIFNFSLSRVKKVGHVSHNLADVGIFWIRPPGMYGVDYGAIICLVIRVLVKKRLLK